jgi:dTDP-3-amino-3,4,6-trideoxy-alpha-D-glucose transaminase
MPVHLYGQLADAEAIAALCRDQGIPMIEDAAKARGARQGAKPAGSFGRLAGFSFYPARNLGAFGDGGAVVTDDDDLARTLRLRRNYGSIHRYQHESIGVNSRLDELQAAWLRVRLGRLAEHNGRRCVLAAQYTCRLADLPGLTLPCVPPGHEPVWHQYVVRRARREALQGFLARRRVQTLVHYPRPVYRFAPFARYAPPGSSRADTLCAEVLSLPMGPHLGEAEVDRVCDEVRAFFGER